MHLNTAENGVKFLFRKLGELTSRLYCNCNSQPEVFYAYVYDMIYVAPIGWNDLTQKPKWKILVTGLLCQIKRLFTVKCCLQTPVSMAHYDVI